MLFVEHKKMSASLDNCQFCFSNIPKHLIVAIGIKVRKFSVFVNHTLLLVRLFDLLHAELNQDLAAFVSP
jgi:Protein similar to CwfJ C-terminus 1